MNHDLKTDSDVFKQAKAGRKTFEIRLADRDYKVGDTLTLHETRYTGNEMRAGKPLEYTGDTVLCAVTYVLHGPVYGLKEGWIVMAVIFFNPY